MSEPAAKRVRTDGGCSGDGVGAAADGAGPAADGRKALVRLTAHAAHAKKMAKVASMAVRLLRTPGALTKEAAPELLELLASSLRGESGEEDLARCRDPALRPAYSALFSAADEARVLRLRQREQLDVWLVTTVLEGTIVTTDDSFEFQRACKELREGVDALPPLEEEERGEELREILPAPGGEADEVEGAERRRQLRLLWARRVALVGCAEAALARHSVAWARTAAEMAIDALASAADEKLPPPLHRRAEALRNQLRDMKTGKSKGGGRRNPTAEKVSSFEKAQSRWAKDKDVSARGGVGFG